MYCQRCRAPLKLHSSVSDLNPASFHLLTNGPPLPEGKATPSHQLYPPERRQRYDDASGSSRGSPQSQESGLPRPQRRGGDRALAPDPSRSSMSFHDITLSQVVPPNEAERVSQQAERKRKSRRAATPNQKLRDRQDGFQSPSERIESAERLFEVLSSRSDVDHPVCADCMELLIEQMEKQLTATERQRDAYIDFLKHAHAQMPTVEEAQKAEADLDACRKEEAAAILELENLERQKNALEGDVAELDRQSKDLDAEEAKFWQERNAFTTTLTELQDHRDSVNLRYEQDRTLLERLQRTDVYKDTFKISHDGNYATINGLRLGRVSEPLVDWAEINAAWGVALLLLDTLAEKLDYTFRGYRLHPLGSTSSIEKLSESASTSPSATRVSTNSVKSNSASTGSDSAKQHTEKPEFLPLHRGEHLPIVSNFIHRRFDQAMVAFLECLRQLGKHVEKTAPLTSTRQFKAPFEIKKDEIKGDSIKLGSFSYDKGWTEACKHILLYCKFLLAHTRDMKAAGNETRGDPG